MPTVTLPELLPGITGQMNAYPKIAAKLKGLAETILLGPSTLSLAEREIIATTCNLEMTVNFCCTSHANASGLSVEVNQVEDILTDASGGTITGRLRALLVIADKVRSSGLLVSHADVSNAREHGADDRAIHDAVLIAAAFSMFNRYDDGLSTCVLN